MSLMPLADWSEPDAVFASDACLTGCGAWYDGQFFHKEFPEFITSQKLHINALELLTIVVALKVWGDSLKGCRIRLMCDNQTSVIVMNAGRSRDKFLQSCLRELCYLAAKYECELRGEHIPGIDNRLPDLLSRWGLGAQFQAEFNERTQGLDAKECIVDNGLFRFSHVW